MSDIPVQNTSGLAVSGDWHPASLEYLQYQSEQEPAYLPQIRELISRDLSEPYSIYVYRYFLYQWGDLCFMVGPGSAQRVASTWPVGF